MHPAVCWAMTGDVPFGTEDCVGPQPMWNWLRLRTLSAVTATLCSWKSPAILSFLFSLALKDCMMPAHIGEGRFASFTSPTQVLSFSGNTLTDSLEVMLN